MKERSVSAVAGQRLLFSAVVSCVLFSGIPDNTIAQIKQTGSMLPAGTKLVVLATLVHVNPTQHLGEGKLSTLSFRIDEVLHGKETTDTVRIREFSGQDSTYSRSSTSDIFPTLKKDFQAKSFDTGSRWILFLRDDKDIRRLIAEQEGTPKAQRDSYYHSQLSARVIGEDELRYIGCFVDGMYTHSLRELKEQVTK